MKGAKREKKKTRVYIGPIAKGVLGMVAIAGAVSALAVAPGLAVAMGPFFKKKKYQPEQAIGRSVDTLLKKGLLKEVRGKNGERSLILTRKGKWEVGIRGLVTKEKQKDKKWDGTWRVIVFDIPKSKGKVRHELRRAVTSYGFKQLQKSVWVYPYPCDDFVQLVKDQLGVSNDVLYMTVSYIENDKHLKKEFGLK